MGLYLCRLIDPSGQVTSELPVVAASDRKAMATARSAFKAHGQHGSFELWQGDRRIALHCDIDGGDAGPPRGQGREADYRHQFG